MTTTTITITVTYDEKKVDLGQDVLTYFEEAAEYLEVNEDVHSDFQVGVSSTEDEELEPEEVEAC